MASEAAKRITEEFRIKFGWDTSFFDGEMEFMRNNPGHWYSEVWAALIAERERVEKLEKALPSSYFSDRPLQLRLERLIADWRRAIQVNQQLDQELADSRQREGSRT